MLYTITYKDRPVVLDLTIDSIVLFDSGLEDRHVWELDSYEIKDIYTPYDTLELDEKLEIIDMLKGDEKFERKLLEEYLSEGIINRYI